MQTLNRTPSWILAATSGFFLILIFPRFNLEFLAWFALIPLFFAIQNQSAAAAAGRGFLAGMVFYFFGLLWVTNTLVNYGNIPRGLSFLLLGLLAAYLSFYVSLFCVLLVKWSRGRPLYFFLLAPLVWTSLEYLRSTHMKFGFSWLGLGYSQYQSLTVIQPAEVTGVYGISALIIFVNAALYISLGAWMVRNDLPEQWKTALRILGVTGSMLALWLGWGSWALERTQSAAASFGTVRVGLAQGNIEQHVKWDPLYRKTTMEFYRDLTLKAAREQPDLIVWPEAATPFNYTLDPEGTQFVRQIARDAGVPLLFGSPYQETRNGESLALNRAFLISADGETIDIYDKMHLVPFGEFVPFRKALFFVEKMVEIIGDFGWGTRATVFDLSGGKFGVSICYEITFPDLVRQSVKNGAEFLVNITNDAWFGKSAASYQHISMAALRAVENRTPVVRAANTGITGIVDATGEIRQATQLFVREVIIGEIAPNKGPRTFYSLYGDIFAYLCLLLMVTVSLLARKNTAGK